MKLTFHAQMRMQQRAVRDRDLPLIQEVGTEFKDGLILLDRNVDKAIFERREEIQRLEKLRGKAVIIAGDTVLTTYNPCRKKKKQILRERISLRTRYYE